VDNGAAAAEEHVAVRQEDGVRVVGDVQDGVLATAEKDDRRLVRPLVLAGDHQIGVAAGVPTIVIVIGDVSGCGGEVEGISDRYVAAHRRSRAHGRVVGGREQGMVATGGGDMDGEEDEDEDDGETW